MPNVPLLLGHRGTRTDSGIAENTPAAFDTCIGYGCDGFEFDVRLTGCGRGLVCHDEVAEGVVLARARADQLQGFPVVQDIICRFAKRVFLDIELKVEGLERMVLETLRTCPPQREYAVSSFLPAVLMELRARSGNVPLGIICDKKSQLAGWDKLPVQYLIVHESLLLQSLVDDVHAANKGIFVWTVNDAYEMRRLAEAGVDVIVSDNPKLLVQTLRPEKYGGGMRGNGGGLTPSAGTED
jgi:glycerophosphoryl diester phosphodiesterase